MEQIEQIAIIANGDKPSKIVVEKALKGINLIIAADGGGNICADMDIEPHVIVGDLDSIYPEVLQKFEYAKIIHNHDQNSSDMQKALQYAMQYKPAKIKIFSALGYRTDHLLENILIFYYLNVENTDYEKVEISLYDNWGIFRYLDPGKYIFKNRKGRIVSFFSLREIIEITMEGFRYNLKSAKFDDFFGGLSNVYESDECFLEFKGSRLIWYESHQK